MDHQRGNQPASELESAPVFAPDTPDSGPAPWRLGFWSLVVTQFQGAFNDNALKFLVIYIIVDMGLSAATRNWLLPLVGALFALPFILFSMFGGFLADRFSKRSVTIGTKWMEVGVMTFCLLALGRNSLALESVGIFLLSSQAALFGPSKYGLLPEILPEKELSWGNGIIELGTFLASIAATVAAGYLAFYFRGQQHWSGVILIACTLLGLATSYSISRVPAANPSAKLNRNPLGDLLAHIRLIREDRILAWAVVGNTYLWFLAALLQFTIVIYGHDILRIDERHISYLQAAVAIGIGTGSLVAGYFSEGKIEYGLIPLGAVGMTVFGFLSAGHGLSLERAALYLGLLGFFGGFYAVPLNALIQYRPAPAHKGGVIAAANLLSWVGVFLSALVYQLLAGGLRLGADQVFFAGASLTLLATLYAVVFLPDSMLRLGLWILTHTLFLTRVEGRDNIPDRGGALFLARKLTLLEAILLAASTDRPIRFLIGEPDGNRPPTALERLMHLAPFSTTTNLDGPEIVLSAALVAFEAGEVVCVAAEGPLAILKEDSPERERLEELLTAAEAPIVTVALRGSSRGALRTQAGRLSWKKPAALPCRVTVRFGRTLRPAVTPVEVRRAVGSFGRPPEPSAPR
jgi:acyl-[acyl-carrier-protein]-phospholipid O-acyltransferase / long-chain-fatty-acid--[acyl-carrier-protein] ligase